MGCSSIVSDPGWSPQPRRSPCRRRGHRSRGARVGARPRSRLGLDWYLGLVSGTTIITDEVPLTNQGRTQGTVDLFIAATGVAGVSFGSCHP